MPQIADSFDLGRLALGPGEGRRLEARVRPGSLELGGQRYQLEGGGADARLDVSRTTTGHALRLRFVATLAGPCMRCLAEAAHRVEVDAREVDQPPSGDAELRSPYVSADELDLRAWARDALVLSLPGKLLCRADCAGLCPECGASLNDVDPAEHSHPQAPDPRWDKLRELRLD